MKVRRWIQAVAVMGALALVLVLAAPHVGRAQEPVPEDTFRRTVTVSGVGLVDAAPDRAILRLGVQTQAETASEAFLENGEAVESLVEALVDAGVSEEDIQTQTVRLVPQFEQPEPVPPQPLPQPEQQQQSRTNEIVGYVATNVVEVRVLDLDSVGEILDAAVAAGSNFVESIRFAFGDPTSILDEAREAAFADAEHKAQQLAELSEAELGEVLTINDFSRPPIVVAQETFVQDRGGAGPILPGTEQIEVNVQVTWALQ